ncbi:calcium-binding protein, partial [Novimethylophilus kurashikiensis]
GGAGADVFRFDTPLDSAGNVDVVTDFALGIDHFELSASLFIDISGVNTDHTLMSSEFLSGAGTFTGLTSQHILFDSTSGALYYDADAVGSSAAVQFATLTGVHSLTAGAFTLV